MIDRLKWKINYLDILDQRLLPSQIKYVRVKTPAQTAKAITDMVTRGAPLIGCTGAYGYALALKNKTFNSVPQVHKTLTDAHKVIKAARPTAVALMYAADRMHNAYVKFEQSGGFKKFDKSAVKKLSNLLDKEAQAVFDEDVKANALLSKYGAKLIKKGSNVMTICNAGALATAGMGTAVGVITQAFKEKRVNHVYALETRPYLQGARLTMFELMTSKIPSTLITDNMSGHIMKTCGIKAIVAGADRIAANGDTANKIGTYMLAVLAKYHKIPFYIAAPVPTFDMKIKTGAQIPIEERSVCEVTKIHGKNIAPKNAVARHPAFDVTPNSLITGIITENGIISPVNAANVAKAVNKK